jgi:predicted nucleic acid-binding Zn ribbon protein
MDFSNYKYKRPKIDRVGGMSNTSDFLSRHSKYARLKKPLEASRVCETARALANGRFSVLSFVSGLLTLGVTSSAQAANLQIESTQIIGEVNEKLGEELVKSLRFKMQ